MLRHKGRTGIYRNLQMQISFLIECMCCLPLCGFADSTPDRFVISGIVTDQSHASIPGATLRLRKGTNAPEQSLVTDDTGVFRFAPVEPGRYELEITRNSFKTLTQRITVRDRDITSLRITLPLAQLSETVVAPGARRRFVIRGGAGFFYDRTGAGAIADTLRFDGKKLVQILITDPAYPDPWSSGTTPQAVPPSLVRFAGNLRDPYTIQYGLGAERQLYKSTTLAVNYVESRGVGLFRSRDINAPLPPFYLSRPDPAMERVRQIESSALSRSRSLEVLFRGNITHYFNSTIQYTTGRAYNDTSGMNAMPADNYDLSGEWSRADFDQRHRFNLLGTFKVGELFKLGISSSLNSGRPYSLTRGRDINNDGNANDRPPGVRRNSLQGPGATTLDIRLSRDVKLTAKKESAPTISLALNVFNVLNHVSYTGYVGNLSSPFFGLPVSARPARRMQIALRFEF